MSLPSELVRVIFSYLHDPAWPHRWHFRRASIPWLDVHGGRNPVMGFTTCGALWRTSAACLPRRALRWQNLVARILLTSTD